MSLQDKEIYQPHSLLNALNCLYGSFVYLRRLPNGIAKISIAFGRSKVVLRHHKLGLLHVRSRWWLWRPLSCLSRPQIRWDVLIVNNIFGVHSFMRMKSFSVCISFVRLGPPRRVDCLALPPVYHIKIEASR